MPGSKKQIQSIVITLAVAVVAIAGFLLVMGRLSAPDTPVDGRDERKANQPVAVESRPEATVADTQRQPSPPVDDVNQSASAEPTSAEGIIAIVNNKIVSREVWPKAARLDAAMHQLTA
jgi:hypothetical protein